MTSKNCWRNALKENMKNRLWSLALVFLCLFVQYPLTAVGIITRREDYSYLLTDSGIEAGALAQRISKMLANEFNRYASMENSAIFLGFAVIASVLAVTGFSYLYRSRETDFYHSLPVKRKDLFLTAYVTGALYFLVPYALNLGASVLIMLSRVSEYLDTAAILRAFLYHSAFFLLIYSVFVLAVMLTGNALSGTLGGWVLGIYGSAACLLIIAYAETFQLTRISGDSRLIRLAQLFSPLGLFFRGVNSDTSGLHALAALVLAALFTWLSLLLYKKRSLEAAGKSVAFDRAAPVIKYLIGAACAGLGGLFFYQILNRDGWAVFGILFVGLVACMVIEIIFRGDFKQLFAGKLTTAAAVLTALLMFLGFRMDVIGYDRYCPAADQVQEVSIHVDRICPDTQWNYYSKPQLETDFLSGNSYLAVTGLEPIELLRALGPVEDRARTEAIVANGLATAAAVRASGYSFNQPYRWIGEQQKGGSGYSTVSVRWLLKNGREVNRNYYVDLDACREAMEKLYEDKGYLRGVYPLLKEDPAQFTKVCYMDWNEITELTPMDKAYAEKLLDVWKKEFEAMPLAQRIKEKPVGGIQFITQEEEAILGMTGPDNDMRYDYHYYPVYPSFEGTVSMLKERGVDPGHTVTEEEIDSIQIYDYEKKDGNQTLTVRDKAQIRQLIDACRHEGMGFTESLVPGVRGLNAEMSVKGSARQEGYVYVMSFTADDVPDFVMEHFGYTADGLRERSGGAFYAQAF